MAKASWKGVELAHSDDYEVVEGNIYFPSGFDPCRIFHAE